MADIRHIWSDALVGDWLIADAGLDASDDLATAVFISLFTDARAEDDDRIPNGSQDRRGWWGDGTDPERRIGSRLWLLAREKTTRETRLRAIDYVRQALAWMIKDGVADRIDVTASYAPGVPTRLELSVVIIRDGATLFSRTFDPFWQDLQS